MLRTFVCMNIQIQIEFRHSHMYSVQGSCDLLLQNVHTKINTTPSKQLLHYKFVNIEAMAVITLCMCVYVL